MSADLAAAKRFYGAVVSPPAANRQLTGPEPTTRWF